MSQFIVICLDDDGRYVQGTRRRFTRKDAKARADGISPSRLPVVVKVPGVVIDGGRRPVRDEDGHFIRED